MPRSYRTSLKPTLVITGLFILATAVIPNPMADGAILIVAPIVAIVVYFLHNLLRWITGGGV